MPVDIQHAHRLLEQLGPGQLAAVVHLLESMLLPAEDGNTMSNAEREAIAEADEWLRHNQPIPHEEVLAEFGLTMADREAMGQETPPEETPQRLSASCGPTRPKVTFEALSSPLRCRS